MQVLKQAVAIVLFSFFLISSSGMVMADSLNEEVTVKPLKTVSAEQQVILSNAAAGVLRHIVETRSAIQKKDKKDAEDQLKKAMTLIEIIKAVRPTGKVTDHIWIAKKHLEYKDTEVVAQDLIPVNADLVELAEIIPGKNMENAREHLKNAKDLLKKGDKKGADKELGLMLDAVSFSEMDLSVESTDKSISAAQVALAHGNLEKADKVLKGAEDNLVIFNETITAPFAQAHKSIWHARKEYEQGKTKKAIHDSLEKAGNWLKEAAKNGDEKTRKLAVELGHQLSELKNKIKIESKDIMSSFEKLVNHTHNAAVHERKIISDKSGK